MKKYNDNAFFTVSFSLSPVRRLVQPNANCKWCSVLKTILESSHSALSKSTGVTQTHTTCEEESGSDSSWFPLHVRAVGALAP